MKCSECEGHGIVEVYRYQGFTRDVGYIDTEPCSECDGSGFDNDSDPLHTCSHEVVSPTDK